MYFTQSHRRLKRKRLPEEPEIPPRAIVQLSADALQKNYRAIQALVPDQFIIPMLKANAYGHGSIWAARLLVRLPGLYGFGVATLEEGKELREGLGLRERKTQILVLSDATPWSDEKGQFCEAYGLTPALASETDWSSFYRGGWHERVPYDLLINTGMNRLGILPSSFVPIARNLKGKPAHCLPRSVFSHFAMSESPESKLTQTQIERFRSVRKEWSATFPGTKFHFSNSGGIWNAKKLGMGDITDVVRPGLSLYGIPPWPGAPARGISPVLSFKVKVAALHRLKLGESIGYSGTYRVTGEGVIAAILSAGYADGIPRSLSNRGSVILDGAKAPFIGNISMDLSAVRCSARTRVGDWAEILGPEMDPWLQAQAAGTIPYELLTSISSRVKRVSV